ncbi:hypothetical protein LCGC14_0666520 [marine sediment metagenome]|uniref:Uncharacterized protein n=1 Tax=marine sediment metagenome TaxID=412755 RepID=A0A0F9TDM1_9ZZZZ
MKSLAYLDFKEILKSIVNDQPKLIYYICHRIDSKEYPNEPLIDEEQDCKILAERHGLMEFKSRSERTTHGVTRESCYFTRTGRNVAIELCEKGICDEIIRLIDQLKKERMKKNESTHISKETFAQEFIKYFTFDEDPTKIIENKINEIKENFNVSLPDNNHEIPINGNLIKIKLYVKNNTLYFDFVISCTCLKGRKTIIQNIVDYEFKKNHFELYYPHIVNCNYCQKIFVISHHLIYILR